MSDLQPAKITQSNHLKLCSDRKTRKRPINIELSYHFVQEPTSRENERNIDNHENHRRPVDPCIRHIIISICWEKRER